VTVELPSSANGFVLQVRGHTLTAAWPAPFFVLVDNGFDPDHPDGPVDEEPLLIHCENLTHAEVHAHGGRILNADFTEYVR
jgi:hypothetical protein